MERVFLETQRISSQDGNMENVDKSEEESADSRIVMLCY